MNLEHHVTSLELSQRLRALGVPQRSHAWWQATYSRPLEAGPVPGGDPKPFAWHVGVYDDQETRFDVSAFLASELLELLPAGFGVQRHEDGYATFDIEGRLDKKRTLRKSAADSLAKALIHLIEQGIVDPGDLAA